MALLALLPLLASAALAQQPTFRAGTQIVPLYVTVTDREGRLVPDLTREDFRIFDEQKPQEVVVFNNEVQPITAVLMLDTSASMTGSLDLAKRAAEQFLLRLLPDDRAVVGAFNDKIEFEGSFTGDRDALVATLKDLDFGNGTRLYDATDESLSFLQGIEGRRVIVLLTDGEDFGSREDAGDVQDRARAEEVMIYGIGMQTEYFNGQRRVRSNPDRALKRMADETGGGYFRLDDTDQLTSTFTRVAQELHSQYVLGFVPQTLDGKVHKLTVQVTKPGLVARARKTYVAAPARPTETR
jgi:Ca-activated chloride channel family protein